jgi:hypothetical protein
MQWYKYIKNPPGWGGLLNVFVNGLEVRENWSFPVWASMDLDLEFVGSLV